MKILILSSWAFLPPFCGTRRVVRDSALGLEERGHQVLVVLAVHPAALGSESAPTFVTVPMSSTWLRSELLTSRLCSLHEPLRYFWSGICKPIRSTVMMATLRCRILTTALAFAPDLILAEDMYIAPLGAHISRQLAIPFCYRVHHLHSLQHARYWFLEKVIETWESRLFRQCDALVALTQEDATLLRHKSSGRILKSPLGLRKQAADESPLPAQFTEDYILYVSSYVGEEEPWLRRLAAHCSPVNVLIVGEGGRDFCHPPQNVVLLGTLPDQLLTRLYRDCAFAFFPLSWSPGQGFPTKLAEALLNDVPILLCKDSERLLPANTESVEVYADETDLQEKIRLLLKHKRCKVKRDAVPFDIATTSYDLEQKLRGVCTHRRLGDV